MRALFLAASAAALTATVPASAGVMTLGGSFAEGCYTFAETHNATYEALATCDRALKEQALSSEDEFATYVNRGIIRMTRRDYPSAQADFDRAVRLDPNRGEAWLNMGVLRFKQGDSKGAIPLFDKALKLGTDAPEVAHFGRALAREDLGDLKAAYADLQRAVTLRPNWRDPARELARYQIRTR